MPDLPRIRVNDYADAYRRRPNVSLRCQGRNHDIGIVRTEQLMHPPGTNVTNERRNVLAEFALDVEIPLQHVIPMGLPFNRNVRERGGGEELKCPAREGPRRQLVCEALLI